MTRPKPLKGRPLPPGGTIGVPAPAGPTFNRSEILRGVEWWELRGFRVKLGDGIYDRDAYVAGDAKSRARDLMAMFADPEVDVVQCARGGFGSAQTIPYLDFDVIAEHPKPFVGFSDITALHVALRQRTGLVTFYGYGLHGVGDKDTTEFTRERMLKVLSGETSSEVPKDPDDPYVRPIRGGRATAPVVGGDLWVLIQTLGTPYEVDLDGCILFFEEVDTPAYQVEGCLTQLAHAGKLDGVAGVVVGDLHGCDWSEEHPDSPNVRSIEDVLELCLNPLGVPVLYKFPLGHGKHNATLPLGVTATLDADARTLSIDEPALEA